MYNLMKVKDFTCGFNMPQQLMSSHSHGEEISHVLPPYAPVPPNPVDEYPACPDNWMHGSDMASSYFLPVKEGHGMWLDFNANSGHTHDVAIVLSIQGINPITGQKMVGSKALRLEQYHKKCPIHNVDFQQDRFCPKCKYKWSGQNYISTTGTPYGRLWIDGFRGEDGKVRQYIITADEKRGVAAQMIGDERVFAIGIAYYISKKKKPELPKPPEREDSVVDNFVGMVQKGGVNLNHTQPMWFSPLHTPGDWNLGGTLDALDGGPEINCCLGGGTKGMSGPQASSGISYSSTSCSSSSSSSVISRSRGSIRAMAASVPPVTPVKTLEVGTGALIIQKIYDDPKPIDYWESKPSGMIYINYCDEETYKQIMDAGKRAEEKEGFLKGVKVGG